MARKLSLLFLFWRCPGNAPDLRAFQSFIIDELTHAPEVESVRTSLVIRRLKHEPAVPISDERVAG